MTDPYYCKLYVETDEDIAGVQEELRSLCESVFGSVAVECPVYRNEDFAEMAATPYDPIFSSRYYAEVGTTQQRPEWIVPFQAGVATLVKAFRRSDRFVTASCGFEGLIAEVTGWNWTDDTPNPPGRAHWLSSRR